MCEHKHIKSVNCVLYCIDCGIRLPSNFLDKKPTEEAKPVKSPKKGKRTKKEESK